ncbi:uncharacterized protein LOC116606011 [Nematostella vectensis]|uniref:uncharacterized protein LOC116606011 n=1 Tax=Nematostella vectensis TaxID=45351 RepID=UPI00207722F7|nr:uncharacterized protein LOC116606011 [Nematostella vectensis]
MARGVVYILVITSTLCCCGSALKRNCLVYSDCGLAKKCCENVCLARLSCDGSCSAHMDCDQDYGEECIKSRCRCVREPCITERGDKQECDRDADCAANKTCINSFCQTRKTFPVRDPNFSPAVLGVVATVGLVMFAGAFYCCLRKQHTSRPSLAAKEAHVRAIERSKSTLNDYDETSERRNADRNSEKSLFGQTNGSNEPLRCEHARRQEAIHKRPSSGLVGSLDLSAIMEEEEISEVTVT